MAVLNITELKELAVDSKGNVMPAPVVPCTSQNVTYTSAASSQPLKKGTKYVRLAATADAYIDFDGTATVASMYLPSGVVEYVGIGTQSLTISVYDGSS